MSELLSMKAEDASVLSEKTLLAAGFNLDKGVITYPDNYKPNDECADAVMYLMMEWDYELNVPVDFFVDKDHTLPDEAFYNN